MSRADDQSRLADWQAVVGEENDDRPAWEPGEEDQPDLNERVRCECGNVVTKQYARVFGDNNDEIDGCHECKSYREITDNGRVGPGPQ